MRKIALAILTGVVLNYLSFSAAGQTCANDVPAQEQIASLSTLMDEVIARRLLGPASPVPSDILPQQGKGVGLFRQWLSIQAAGAEVEAAERKRLEEQLLAAATRQESDRYIDLARLSLLYSKGLEGDHQNAYDAIQPFWANPDPDADVMVKADALNKGAALAALMGHETQGAEMLKRALQMLPEKGLEYRAVRYFTYSLQVTIEDVCQSIPDRVETVMQILKTADELNTATHLDMVVHNFAYNIYQQAAFDVGVAFTDRWFEALDLLGDEATIFHKFSANAWAALMHYGLGDIDQAGRFATKATQIIPDPTPVSESLYLMRAEYLIGQGDRRLALEALDKAREMSRIQTWQFSPTLVNRVAFQYARIDYALGNSEAASDKLFAIMGSLAPAFAQQTHDEAALVADLFTAVKNGEVLARQLAETRLNETRNQLVISVLAGLILLTVLVSGFRRLRLTMRKKRSAEQANQAKSLYLTRTTHDLRTPLNAILGYSELMAREMLGPHTQPRYRGYAEMIQKAAHSLLDIINTNLDLARIESGVDKLDEVSFDLAAMLEDVTRLSRQLGRQQGINVRFVAPHGEILIYADKQKMWQILTNLCGNATKYNKAGGWIELEVLHPKTGGLTIAITNSGDGLTQDEIDLALTEFGMVMPKGTTETNGTGLGLSVVCSLVEAHGATFSLTSEKGSWTRAEVTLPVHRLVTILSEAETQEAAPVEPETQLNPAK